MDDGLDIPEFLRRTPLTAEQQEALRQKWAREDRGRPATSQADYTINRDRKGRPLPRSMDATSWAILAANERADEAKEAVKQAASEEFFRVREAERAEIRAVKQAAKKAQKERIS